MMPALFQLAQRQSWPAFKLILIWIKALEQDRLSTTFHTGMMFSHHEGIQQLYSLKSFGY